MEVDNGQFSGPHSYSEKHYFLCRQKKWKWRQSVHPSPWLVMEWMWGVAGQRSRHFRMDHKEETACAPSVGCEWVGWGVGRCVPIPHISELGRCPPPHVGKLSISPSSGLLNSTLRFFLYPSTQHRLSGRGGPSGSRGDTGEEFRGRNNTEEERLAHGGALRSCSLFVRRR